MGDILEKLIDKIRVIKYISIRQRIDVMMLGNV